MISRPPIDQLPHHIHVPRMSRRLLDQIDEDPAQGDGVVPPPRPADRVQGQLGDRAVGGGAGAAVVVGAVEEDGVTRVGSSPAPFISRARPVSTV
jgi:hypothetical protein